MVNKLWRIKKEHLNAEGCFAYGGGVADVQAPAEQPQMPTSASVNPFSGFFSPAPQAAPSLDLVQSYDPQKGILGTLFGAPPVEQPAPIAPQMPAASMQPAVSIAPQAPNIAAPYMQEAKVTGDIAKQQAGVIQQSEQRLAAIANEAKAHEQELSAKRNEIVDYLDKNPVDAKRYYESKSDLGKVSTAFGLILGGIGGGLNKTGQNVALDFLNKQIDQDVRAQVENRNTKANLLSHLEKQFGNEQDARKMLQSTLQTSMANKLQQAALASGDKLAMARAQQVVQQLQAQANAPLAAAAAERALNSALASGQDMTEVSPFMDEKQRARAIPGMGLAASAELAKKMNEEVIPAYKGSIDGIDQLQKMGVIDKFDPKQRALATSIQNRLIGQMRQAILGPGTISDSERQTMKQIIANPTDLFSIANTEKLKNLKSALTKDFEARAKQSGVSVPRAQHQPANSQIKIQFTPKK